MSGLQYQGNGLLKNKSWLEKFLIRVVVDRSVGLIEDVSMFGLSTLLDLSSTIIFITSTIGDYIIFKMYLNIE